MSKILETSQEASTGNNFLDPSETERGHLQQRWTTPIDHSLANVPLLGCCFITGLLDTTMFQGKNCFHFAKVHSWGLPGCALLYAGKPTRGGCNRVCFADRCAFFHSAYGTFVSMQTGNTIFLALGASNQNNKPYDWARSLCSIGCFATGAFFFSRLHKRLGPKPTQRGTLAASFLIQSVCICVAAALIQTGFVGSRNHSGTGDSDWTEMAPIAFLSFQAAGQIVASRVLGVNELPTVVITSLLCDLMSDPKLLAWPIFSGNRKRTNRVVGFILTLVGSIIGGWMLKGTGIVTPVLWLVFAIKFVICLGWILWKGEGGSKAEIV